MKSNQKQISTFKNTPNQMMFKSRSFVVQQAADKPEQADLKTSLNQAERYGHHLTNSLDTSQKQGETSNQTQRVNQPVIQHYNPSRGNTNASSMLPGSFKFSTHFPYMKYGNQGNAQQAVTPSNISHPLPPGGAQIPQNMHFYWSGNTPGRPGKEWDHLQQWGNMEGRNGWGMNLWTDNASYTAWQQNYPQRLQELQQMGIDVRIADNQIDPKNRPVYDYAIANNAPTMASDIARLNILKNQGGVYTDLDMTPGNLSLPRPGDPALSSGQLPFFGPRIQSESSLIKPTAQFNTFDQRLQQTINNKYTEGSFGNQLIAAEPNNPTINMMINQIETLNGKLGTLDPNPNYNLTPGNLGQAAPYVTGPHMAQKIMTQQLGLPPHPTANVPQATGYMNPQWIQNVHNMRILTPASNDLGERA